MLQRILILLIVSITMAAPSFAGPPEIPSAPSVGIADIAQVISPGDEALLQSLVREARIGGVQMAILTVKSTKGEDTQVFATRVARSWQLGSIDRDNGLLILLAADDHSWAIKPGIGLETILTRDAINGIAAEHLVPQLRAGHVGRGLFDTACGLLSRVTAAGGGQMPTVAKWKSDRSRPAAVAFSPTDAAQETYPRATRDSNRIGLMLTMGAVVVGLILLFMILATVNRRNPDARRSRVASTVPDSRMSRTDSNADDMTAVLGGIAATTALMATEHASQDASVKAATSITPTGGFDHSSGTTGMDVGGAFSDGGGASGSW